MAAKPSLDPGTEWPKLLCLKCQGDNCLDDVILKCLINVQEAIRISLEPGKQNKDKSKSKTLWYQAGLLLADGLPYSGVTAHLKFGDQVKEIVECELKASSSGKTSIFPWDGLMNGYPPKLLLEMSLLSQAYSRGKTWRKRSPDKN